MFRKTAVFQSLRLRAQEIEDNIANTPGFLATMCEVLGRNPERIVVNLGCGSHPTVLKLAARRATRDELRTELVQIVYPVDSESQLYHHKKATTQRQTPKAIEHLDFGKAVRHAMRTHFLRVCDFQDFPSLPSSCFLRAAVPVTLSLDSSRSDRRRFRPLSYPGPIPSTSLLFVSVFY